MQQEVERLEMRAALHEEEAKRAGSLEDEARAREELVRELQNQARPRRLRASAPSARVVYRRLTRRQKS